MTAPVITVAGLRKRYGDKLAVADVGFEVRPGEIFGILGPNDAGKTTTVECLTGLRTPDAGELRVLGLDPRHDRAALRERVGVQLQESELPARITAREALALYASFYEHPADATALARGLGLTAKLGTQYRRLSGGQKQRLSIALALIGSPEVAVLDELTTGLDPQARRDTWDLIAGVRDSGVTIVLVTHFMDEAERLCDRVALIDDGRVVASDTPAGLAARAQGDQVLRLRTQVRADATRAAEVVRGLGPVREVREVDGELVVTGERDAVVAVVRALDAAGIAPVDLQVDRATLEDAFVRLTRNGSEA